MSGSDKKQSSNLSGGGGVDDEEDEIDGPVGKSCSEEEIGEKREKRVSFFRFNSAKKKLLLLQKRKKRKKGGNSVNSRRSGKWVGSGCCLCLKQPMTLDSSAESPASDPNRIGGLGKTTLARFVYNNYELSNHFGKQFWVSVSEDFEPKRIFKLMLESLTTESPVGSFKGRDTIVQKIGEKLKGNNYLLVLDDVWNEDSQLWDDFLGSLAGISSSSGNWIIVTTRNVLVASNCPSRYDLSLKKLTDEDCLLIVKEKAFLSKEEMQEFEAIGEKINELCQGLPLVASVVGGLLRTNPRDQWISVLREGISYISGDKYSGVNENS